MEENDRKLFYKEQFDRFEEGKLREGNELDKIVRLISAGTLVLSINYIIGLKDHYLVYPILLIFSWISLLLSIVIQTIGYKISKEYHVRYIEELKKWFESGSKYPFMHSQVVTKHSRRSDSLTNWSIYLLIMGLSLITIFAILNFLNTNKIIYSF